MTQVEVYDPPMCCSTGVCGPEPEEKLARFSADLDWLKRQGVQVRRYNLAQEPTAFTSQPEVSKIVNETGGDGLPVVMINGIVVSQGEYPSRQRLAELTGLPGDASSDGPVNAPTQRRPIFDERIAELVALGAAIAANCEPCLQHHYRKAVELGIHHQDMIQTVNVALQVKQQSARMVARTAEQLLAPEVMPAATVGCCSGSGRGNGCG